MIINNIIVIYLIPVQGIFKVIDGNIVHDNPSLRQMHQTKWYEAAIHVGFMSFP